MELSIKGAASASKVMQGISGSSIPQQQYCEETPDTLSSRTLRRTPPIGPRGWIAPSSTSGLDSAEPPARSSFRRERDPRPADSQDGVKREEGRYRHRSGGRSPDEDDRERLVPKSEDARVDRETRRARSSYRHREERLVSDGEQRERRERQEHRDRDGDRSRRKRQDSDSKSSRRRSHSPDDHRQPRRRDASEESRRRRRRSDTFSSSDTSELEDERRRRRRKDRKKRDKTEDKAQSRNKERSMSTISRPAISWGKYGVISEADMFRKGSEFRTWLIEERRLNPEMIPRERTYKEFAVFVEDHNTATFPHEKYYDIEKYHMKMRMIRSGHTLPIDGGTYDASADLKAHSSRIKAQKRKPSLTREEVEDLRQIERERVEMCRLRQLGIDIPRTMGVRADYVEFKDMKFD